MINDKKNIDKLFADGLKTHKAQTPIHAWEGLSNSLDNKQSHKKYLYVRLLAASVAILLAFGAGYFFANYNEQLPVLVNQDAPEELNNNEQFTFTDENQNKQLEEPFEETKLSTETKIEAPKTDDGNSGLTSSEYNLFASNEISKSENTNSASSVNLFSRNELEVTHLKMVPADKVISSSEQPIRAIVSKADIPSLNINTPEFTGVEYTYNGTGKKEAIKNRWTIGAQFAPTYSYREISTNYENSGQVDPNTNNYLNDNEEALNSYAGGLNVDFAVNKRWSLQSGMYYSRIGQVNNDALEYVSNGKDNVLYAVNTSTGNISISFEKIPDNIRIFTNIKDSDNSPESVQIEQNFDFFEVPFLLKYKVLNRKFSVNLSGGLSPAYLVENKTYLKVDNEKYDVGGAANLNSLLLNTSVGLGLEYRAFKKVSFSLEPTFKYSLVSLNKGSQFFYHPYSLSWFTGVKFTF